MSKKIMILNGSPRKNGNTSALVKAFTEGAESAGIQYISTANRKSKKHASLEDP